MTLTDPIADMLTRINNANRAYHSSVDIPLSKIKENIAKILLEEGYIKDYKVITGKRESKLRIFLKYKNNKERVITGVKRISKPGLRIYAKKDELPRVLRGLGIAIISTSKGIMTDQKARELGIGGEVLAYVW